MEPITLCGLVIVAFCWWLELETHVMALLRGIGNSKALQRLIAQLPVMKPVCVNRYVPYTR